MHGTPSHDEGFLKQPECPTGIRMSSNTSLGRSPSSFPHVSLQAFALPRSTSALPRRHARMVGHVPFNCPFGQQCCPSLAGTPKRTDGRWSMMSAASVGVLPRRGRVISTGARDGLIFAKTPYSLRPFQAHAESQSYPLRTVGVTAKAAGPSYSSDARRVAWFPLRGTWSATGLGFGQSLHRPPNPVFFFGPFLVMTRSSGASIAARGRGRYCKGSGLEKNRRVR